MNNLYAYFTRKLCCFCIAGFLLIIPSLLNAQEKVDRNTIKDPLILKGTEFSLPEDTPKSPAEIISGQDVESFALSSETSKRLQKEPIEYPAISDDLVRIDDLSIPHPGIQKMQTSDIPLSVSDLVPTKKGVSIIRLEAEEASPDASKATGSVTLSSTTQYVIADQNSLLTSWSAPSGIPGDAWITSVEYWFRIIPDGSNSIYCGDYEIYISNATHGTGHADGLCVYDNLGGFTDGGYDDDAEDDYDIYLAGRTTSYFNGESPTQTWHATIRDMYAGDHGMRDYIYLYVYWESPDYPNLTDYTPSGWDGPIVLSSETGTHTNGPDLREGSTLYMDYCYANVGTGDISSSETFYNYIYIDGTYHSTRNKTGLASGNYAYGNDVPIELSEGTHTITVYLDGPADIAESSESDNTYSRTFTVGPPLPNLQSYTPSGWDGPIVVSSVSGTHTNGPVLYADETSYIDFCYANIGGAITGGYYADMYIDGSNVGFWYDSDGIGANTYSTLSDLTYTFSAGTHEICISLDLDGFVTESNESDNYYCRSFTFEVAIPDPPALVSPVNGATCVPSSVTLDWDASAGATYYHLQLDDNSDFSSPSIDEDYATTGTSISSLPANTTLYWRVYAGNSSGTSSYSSSRYFTTSPEGPAAPTLTAPSTGQSCINEPVTMEWAAVSGAVEYQIAVDDNIDFSSPEIDQITTNTEYSTSSLSNGVTYYWFVRGINACGEAGSWSTESWFTIIPNAPAAPSLSTPANSASCQALSLSLDWGDVSGASGYDVQVDNNSDFSSPVASTSVGSSSYAVSGLANNTNYYWRARAENSCGLFSSWSTVRSFTTTPAAPAAPSLSSPANGASCQPTTTTLDWNDPSAATSYNVQVDNNIDFSSPVFTDNTGSSSVSVSGLSVETTYYWRVQSVNSCGEISSWSSSRNFTTLEATPATPVLSSPANSAGCMPLSLQLSWNTASNADSYHLQVDDDPAFGSPAASETGISATAYTVTGLSNGTIYHWRVKAVNACGTEGSWSANRSFTTTTSVADAAILSAPADNSSCMATTQDLQWSNGANTVTSELQVDDNADFSSPVVSSAGLTGTSYELTGLSEGTEYFWKVRGQNDCGAGGDWSPVWSFTTTMGAAATPVPGAPADESTDVSTSISLSWGASTNAEEYSVQVSSAEDFSSPLVDMAGITDTYVNLNGLSENTTYFWHVRAENSCSGASDWSTVWEFTTEGPSALTLTASDNYELGQNYPNPFNSYTCIDFVIPHDQKVSMEIIDADGKLIHSSEEFYKTGKNTYTLEIPLRQGAYFYRMRTNNFISTKMLLVK